MTICMCICFILNLLTCAPLSPTWSIAEFASEPQGTPAIVDPSGYPLGASLKDDEIVIPYTRGGDLPIAMFVIEEDDWLRQFDSATDDYFLLSGHFAPRRLGLSDGAGHAGTHTLKVCEAIILSGYRDEGKVLEPSPADVKQFRVLAPLKHNATAFDQTPRDPSNMMEYRLRIPVSLLSARSLRMLLHNRARLLVVSETWVAYPLQLESIPAT